MPAETANVQRSSWGISSKVHLGLDTFSRAKPSVLRPGNVAITKDGSRASPSTVDLSSILLLQVLPAPGC